MTIETPPVQPTYRARPLPFIILGLLFLVGAVALSRHWIKNKPEPESVERIAELLVVDNQPVKLDTHTVNIEAQGFVRAKTRSTLSAEVSGKVQWIDPALDVGTRVKKGQRLLSIDDTDYQAALVSAKATLASAERQLAEEEARATQAKRDINRLNIQGNELAQRKPQLAQARAEIKRAQAQIKLAEKNLARTIVTAPFDGVVTQRQIDVGEIINVGTPIAELIDIETFTATAALTPAQLQHIQGIGSPVQLFDTLTNQNYQATISRIAPEFDENNRTINIYVDIANPYDNPIPMRLDTFVQLNITGKSYPDSTWLSNRAIVDNQFVWQLTAENTLKKAPIDILFQQDEQSLVTFNKTIEQYIPLAKDAFVEDLAVIPKNESLTNQPAQEKAENDKNASASAIQNES